MASVTIHVEKMQNLRHEKITCRKNAKSST